MSETDRPIIVPAEMLRRAVDHMNQCLCSPDVFVDDVLERFESALGLPWGWSSKPLKNDGSGSD